MQTPPLPPEGNPRPWPANPAAGQPFDGYAGQQQPQPGDAPGGGEPREPLEDSPKPSRFPRILTVLLVLTAVLLLLRFQVFVIRKVNISGLTSVSVETAAKAAGLDRSLFYFFVNEDKIRQGINANRYLVFERMEKIIPGTVNLVVRERKPFAFFTHLGVGYVMAQDGIILEQTRDLSLGKGLVLVNGLAIWGQQSPGSLPASTDPTQAQDMVALFSELAQWGFTGQLQAIDIAQSLNLSMQTIDGYTINLGSSELLHAKVGTVASVVNELRRRQMAGGIIEATLPGEATYRANQ